jgi:hypothetical protein
MGLLAMNRIIVDQTTITVLNNLDHSTEICDPSGHVVGYFTPVADRELYAELDIPTDEQELLRRENELQIFSTAEILEHLKKL